MRLVTAVGPGVVAFNFMWAPTFLGMGGGLKAELENKLAAKIEGKPMTEETLDMAHDLIVELILEKYPTIEGLRDYLDAIKFVREG